KAVIDIAPTRTITLASSPPAHLGGKRMASAAAASTPSRAAEWRAASIKVGAAILVLAGLLALYSHEVKVETRVKELLAGPPGAQGGRAGGARAALARDTPAGWLAAE